MAWKSFKVGDKVRWSSQAAGSWTEKVGVIVAVVPPGQCPRQAIDGLKLDPHRTTIDPRSLGNRNHESYMVFIQPEAKRGLYKTKLGGPPAPLPVAYWPNVSKLELAGSEQ